MARLGWRTAFLKHDLMVSAGSMARLQPSGRMLHALSGLDFPLLLAAQGHMLSQASDLLPLLQ
jgi:hypothetical protein